LPVDHVPEPAPFTYSFHGRAFQFIQPRDPDAILNALTSEEYERDEFLPYWTDHWPSAQVLIEYLINNPAPRESRIIELGSGLGITTALLAESYPGIIATDISFAACSFARRNIGTVTVPAVLCCDWRFPAFKQRADLIIGSDILYEKRWKRPVLDFIEQMLVPGGQAFIADPRRPYWEKFQSRAKDRGFTCDIVDRQTVNEGKSVIEIARIKRKWDS
jgi:ETFB lysine methyltransferase